MAKALTIRRAVWLGQLAINLPVVAIIFSTMGLGLFLAPLLNGMTSLPLMLATLVAFIVISILPGWLYWSFAVPRWKLWAYSRVEDVDALKCAAIGAGLIWPDGHFLERTEVCPKAMRAQIFKLEGRA